jgi:hypothetical protein
MNSILYKLYFTIRDNFTNILRSLISSFGILFLICFFVIYTAIRDSVTTYIAGSLLDNLASDEIRILPKNAKSVEFVKRPGSASISGKQLEHVSAMKELKEINPISRAGFNVRLKGELMDKKKTLYVPVCGVDRSLLSKNRVPGWKNFYNRKPVPVIVPRFTIDIMNNYLSMDGLPPLAEKDFIRFPLELRFSAGKKDTLEYKEYYHSAEIFNFIDIAAFPGVILPTDFIKGAVAEYKKDTGRSMPMDYAVIYAKVKDSDSLPAVDARLKKLGLRVESQKEIVEKTRETMNIIDGFFFAIMGVFFIVSVVSIFNSYLTIVYIRSQKFSLKRVLGFSKLQILLSFVFEAALIGAIYGVAGYFTGSYILSYAGGLAAKWIPVLSSIKLQAGGADILVLCISLSTTVCAISALIPAFFASNINLFKAVRR